MLIKLAAVNCSFNADHGKVARHTIAAKNALCAPVGKLSSPCDVAGRLFASNAVGNCDSVQDHLFVGCCLTLTASSAPALRVDAPEGVSA